MIENDYYTPLLPPLECDHPYSVTQINDGIASLIESANTLVWVEGEVSNFKHASSGHCYFKLIDQQSQIPAVMWRSNARQLAFELYDGMAVIVIASIRTYRKGGYYQLEIHRLQPAGSGVLYLAFEKLRNKLEAEGLFDAMHKKSLPEPIKVLGVITSKTGAVIHDILTVIQKRAPQTDIILRSVQVQGDKAPDDIINAIDEMNSYGKDKGKIDCIILGRGGGAVEDLWAFNHEGVVRAIFNSDIPIITAIGHEIDFTLADFAADMRAPTPSAAAEIAVSDIKETQRYFEELVKRLCFAFQTTFTLKKYRFQNAAYSHGLSKIFQRLSHAEQQLDSYRDRSIHDFALKLDELKQKLSHCTSHLHALNPLSILSRGYSIVSTNDGLPVKNSQTLNNGDTVHITFSSGHARATITFVDHSDNLSCHN